MEYQYPSFPTPTNTIHTIFMFYVNRLSAAFWGKTLVTPPKVSGCAGGNSSLQNVKELIALST